MGTPNGYPMTAPGSIGRGRVRTYSYIVAVEEHFGERPPLWLLCLEGDPRHRSTRPRLVQP
jgi:hypothetical protein